jgi:hypothetical protein
MNATTPLEVDHGELDQTVERLLLEAPRLEQVGPDAAQPEADTSSTVVEGEWATITPGIVQAIDLLVIPQWGVTDREKAALIESLTGVLDAAFPGGISDERYAPYIRFSLVTFGVVMAHRDPDKGFPPLWPKRSEPEPAPDENRKTQ